MVEALEQLSKQEVINIAVEQDAAITQLKAELAQIKKLIYGSKSERFVPAANPQQILLDLDIPSDKTAQAVKQQSISYIRRQQKQNIVVSAGNGRMSFPLELPRIEIIIEPKENITGLKKIGEEITEELELEPARFYVNKYIRPKYAKADGEGILIGELPSRPIEKGIPGPGLLATIITDKYMDHLPLYRQLKRYERMGVKLSDSTFSSWVQSAADLLEPLYEELKKQVLSEPYIQADETPIKVLDPDKKNTTHRGYYWVYHSPHKKLVLFDYREGRGRDGPSDILKNFSGYLQTDGYGVYDDFNKEKIYHLNCMAHARRMFEEALQNDKVRAEYVLLKIQGLYQVERFAKENHYSHEQRYVLRQERSLPILTELQHWLKQNILEVLPKSLIGKAIAYSVSRWDKLYLYIQHGQLEIDNNLVENAIRPVALGRKNYLFAGSHRAAQRAAMLYSLLASCKNNGVEPNQWLKNILKVLPDHKGNRLYELLPSATA